MKKENSSEKIVASRDHKAIEKIRNQLIYEEPILSLFVFECERLKIDISIDKLFNATHKPFEFAESDFMKDIQMEEPVKMGRVTKMIPINKKDFVLPDLTKFIELAGKVRERIVLKFDFNLYKIEDYKVSINEERFQYVIDAHSGYADTPEKIEYYNANKKFTDAFNEFYRLLKKHYGVKDLPPRLIHDFIEAHDVDGEQVFVPNWGSMLSYSKSRK